MVQEVAEQALIIGPVIGLGIILGLYELLLIHRDERFRGSHWLGHGTHSVVVMIIALFAVMNTEYFLEITGLIASGIPLISNVLIVRIAVGFILAIKMWGVSSVIKGGGGVKGMHEGLIHILIVAALVVAAPYYWPLLKPVLEPVLPGWMLN